MKKVRLLCRVVLAAVFVTAGLAKIADPAGFADSIRRFELFPEVFVVPLAYYLPWLEVVAGLSLLLSLLLPGGFRGAWWVVGVVLLGATLAIAQAYFRGLIIDCGCWGKWWELSAGWALVRNAVLIGAWLLARPVSSSQGPTHP